MSNKLTVQFKVNTYVELSKSYYNRIQYEFLTQYLDEFFCLWCVSKKQVFDQEQTPFVRILGETTIPLKGPNQFNFNWPLNEILLSLAMSYSRVHKSSDSFFSKILEKPSIVKQKMIPHRNGLHFSMRWSKKKFQNGRLKNSKWPPQKNLIFQLRQFSIFFHEIFIDWS